MTKLVVLNESKRVSASDVGQMVAAVRRQAHEAARLIDRYLPSIRTAARLPAGAVPLVIVDDPGDLDRVLGFHDITPDGPYGRIFTNPVLDNGGSALGDRGDPSLSVSAVLSHELLEWWYDPTCNFWADRGRSSIALELCDPVEADWYRIDGVAVSNYVLPAWFDPLNKTGPWDFLGKLHGPFTMTRGGYWIEMADGGVRQVFGSGSTATARAAMQINPARGSRTRIRVQAQEDS
jgi:hypothetical protein